MTTMADFETQLDDFEFKEKIVIIEKDCDN